MTIDERIEALTKSVEELVSIHKDHEFLATKRDSRLARLESAMMGGMAAFWREWQGGRGDGKA